MRELSIVIPTYNRATSLKRCLLALTCQTQPTEDFEVIVIVDGSVDETVSMLARLKTPYKLRVLEQPNSGQCVALNRGLKAAEGTFCLLLDDDIVAGPSLVEEHLALQRRRPAAVGIGQLTISLRPGADDLTRCMASWWRDHYALLGRGQRSPTYQDAYSGNLSAPRDALLAVGGFAEDLPRSFDVELAYRLGERGLSFVYLHRAVGDQDYRKGYDAVTADNEQAGIASIELYQRHPAMLRDTPLGAFAQCSLRVLLLRRILLALAPPPTALRLVGRLLPGWRSKHPWYRFLHSYCYWRGVKSTAGHDLWRRLTWGPLVLMYHAFATENERPSRYVLPRRLFGRQLRWLRRRGYHLLGLDDLLACRREHRLPPAKSVVITMDDGYADNLHLAGPILRRFRCPATLFLVTGAAGSTNTWSTGTGLADRRILSWSDVDSLGADGVKFGSHTRSHPSLPCVPPRCQDDEIRGSREDLERHCGRPIRVFAYPFGEYDASTMEAVERAGFESALSTHTGPNDPAVPSLALRRNEVLGTDSLLNFALMVWLGKPFSRVWRGQG